MDEDELERRLRDGLATYAEDVDVTAPVRARATEEVQRRRTVRWGAVGAAAAAVVVIAGGVSVLGSGTSDREQEDSPPAASEPTDDASAPPGEWRTEYWAGLAVDVPDDWGYGGAPLADGTACFPEAMVDADGQRIEESGDRGHVGRPIAATDACALVPQAWQPTAPYVWLGAEIELGTYEYANGYVQETVEVDGVTLTVGSDDAGLREHILNSARAGDVCEPVQARVPSAKSALTTEGRGELVAARICAYRGDRGGPYTLVHAAVVAPEKAQAALLAQERAPEPKGDCNRDPFEFVVLHAAYDDPFGPDDLHRVTVFDTDCGQVLLGRGFDTERQVRAMVPGGVAPWADGGIAATIVGAGAGEWQYDYFIGIQG